MPHFVDSLWATVRQCQCHYAMRRKREVETADKRWARKIRSTAATFRGLLATCIATSSGWVVIHTISQLLPTLLLIPGTNLSRLPVSKFLDKDLCFRSLDAIQLIESINATLLIGARWFLHHSCLFHISLSFSLSPRPERAVVTVCRRRHSRFFWIAWCRFCACAQGSSGSGTHPMRVRERARRSIAMGRGVTQWGVRAWAWAWARAQGAGRGHLLQFG